MLTPKREKFALALHKGLSQREAYREAYPTSKKWKDSSVDSEANKLAKNTEVILRLEELKEKEEKEIQKEKIWTFKESATALKWMIGKSKQDIEGSGFRTANSKAFIDAIKELNAMYGMNAETTSKINIDKARIEKTKVETEQLKGIADEIEDISPIIKEIYEVDDE